MNATLEDWKNGWFGVRLSMSPAEIDRLIALLQYLKVDPDQHFHITSDYAGSGGLGDIEVSIQEPSQPHNLRLGSLALGRGGTVTDGRA